MRLANKIEEREALVRQIQKELIALSRAKHELGEIPLKKPIRHGWYKHLVLRDDISKRKDAVVFQEILTVCAEWVWGSSKQLADKNWDHYVKHNRGWQWAGFAWIEKKEYKSLSPKAQRYFIEYEWKWIPWLGSVKRYYCVVPKYFFEVSYERAYITHRKVIDSELEQKTQELENRLLSNDLFAHSRYAHGWRDKWQRKIDIRKDRHRSKIALKSYDEGKYDQMVGKALM